MFFIPTFFLFWLTISLIYLEGSFYSEEILTTTFATGAWFRVYLLSITFICSTRLAFVRGEIDVYRLNCKRMSFFESMVLWIIFIYIFLLASSLPSLLSILDRREFYQSDDLSIFLLKYITLISFLFGYFYALFYRNVNFKFERLLITALLILINIIFLVLGHKFSQFLDFLFFFALGFSIKIGQLYSLRRKFILIGIIFATLILFAFLNYQYKYDFDFDSLIELIEKRVFIYQGQLAWATDLLWGLQDKSISLSEFLKYINDPLIENNYTILYLMIEILGFDKAELIFKSGQIFSGAFPSVFLIISENFVVCLLAISIYGIIFSSFLKKLIREMFKRRLFFVILLFTAFYPFITFLYNADISAFLSWHYYLKVLACIFVQLFYFVLKNDDGLTN